ncbi:MAG TPA: hypothetical protein VEX37_11380, partial [Thermomicrobiales bacterium]|nr:hypothetical protein [Thermomicrobiales bacterium]
ELLRQAMIPVEASEASDCVYLAESQHNVCGDFASFFAAHGGSDVFGLPLTEQYIIGGMPVQYFERARFEWHAGAGGEADHVLLTRLGAAQWYAQSGREIDTPAVPIEDEGCLYEYSTGHNICDEFAYHWVSSGSALTFGYPLTEAFDRDGLHLQYFERARFELHHRADGTVDLVVAPLGLEEIEHLLSSGSNQDGTESGD